jgi:hypothetical protein
MCTPGARSQVADYRNANPGRVLRRRNSTVSMKCSFTACPRRGKPRGLGRRGFLGASGILICLHALLSRTADCQHHHVDPGGGLSAAGTPLNKPGRPFWMPLSTHSSPGATGPQRWRSLPGYSRTAIYRQFPNRRQLLEALVQRTTQRGTCHRFCSGYPRAPVPCSCWSKP